MKNWAASCRKPAGPDVIVLFESSYAAAHRPAFANALELLASEGAAAAHRWIIKHREGDCIYLFGPTSPPKDVVDLAHHIADWAPISLWQASPASARRAYCKRVAKLARDLAALLNENVRPDLPTAWNLFDPQLIQAALEADPSFRPVPLLIEQAGVRRRARARIKPAWPRPLRLQRTGPMLSRLAEHVESAQHDRLTDSRPNTGNPHQRTAARHLAAWFQQNYRRIPNEVVADLVNLMVPSRDSPATDVSVREWRGAK